MFRYGGFFTAISIIAVYIWKGASERGASLVIPGKKQVIVKRPTDEEVQVPNIKSTRDDSPGESDFDGHLVRNTSYTV